MPALKSGSKVGSYEVRDSIGAGGMGEVYRARDSRLKRDVAILSRMTGGRNFAFVSPNGRWLAYYEK